MKTTYVLAIPAAFFLFAGCSSGGAEPLPNDAKPAVRAAAEPALAPEPATPAPEPAATPDPAAVEPVAAVPIDPSAPEAAPGVDLLEREGVSLGSLVIARGVEKRQPVEPGTSFSLAGGNKLYAIMEVNNPEKLGSELSVAWLLEGSDGERGAVTLAVGEQPKWRTWAYHSGFKKPGRWAAVVRDAGGVELGRATFDVTE